MYSEFELLLWFIVPVFILATVLLMVEEEKDDE